MWVSKAIRAGLTLYHIIWKKRNGQLYQIDRIKNMEGIEELSEEAEKNWIIGMGDLSRKYRPLFKISLKN